MMSNLLCVLLALSSLRLNANMIMQTNCDVYAFVDATPISGPALM